MTDLVTEALELEQRIAELRPEAARRNLSMADLDALAAELRAMTEDAETERVEGEDIWP